jgi:hypothetical protein
MRAWAVVGALGVLATSALLVMGLAVSGPPTVSAQRFVVVDGRGTAHASFGLVGDGSPAIGFNDDNGVTRVMIGIVGGEPEVSLASADGKVRWTAR